MSANILAFDGSGRQGSMNHKILMHVAAIAEKNGAKVTMLDLTELNLPMYNGDLEQEAGLPDGAKKLKELLAAHEALLIASPEYNGGYSPLLKNAIDWASRGPTGLAELRGKVAGLVATAPGKLGGLRGLYQLNTVLFGIGVLVLPEIVSIGFYKEAIDEAGNLKNDKEIAAIEKLGNRIVQVTQGIKSVTKVAA
jgi:chromate reductase, NAD(P)H dehydrogenase (quinone)